MSILSKAALVAAGVATLALATPSLADWDHHEHRDGGGDVAGPLIAGAVLGGAIALIATSHHHDHEYHAQYGYVQLPNYGYGYRAPVYSYEYNRYYARPNYGYQQQQWRERRDWNRDQEYRDGDHRDWNRDEHRDWYHNDHHDGEGDR